MPRQERPENDKKLTEDKAREQARPAQTGAGGESEPLLAGRTVPLAIDRDPHFTVTVDNLGQAINNAPPPDFNTDPAAALNIAIQRCTASVKFNNYADFINRVFCPGEASQNGRVFCDRFDKEHHVTDRLWDAANPNKPLDIFRAYSNLYAYDLLKAATEAYLALQCACYSTGTTPTETDDVFEALNQYLIPIGGSNRILPYINAIAHAYIAQAKNVPVSLCAVSPISRFQPCCIELIWSYWLEEGMLVQTINAISLRFQNRRIGAGRDPLAHLELEPLRPLNNLLWGYIQDEQHRLTVARRAYEYQHEYGLTLYGKAVPALNPADVRSKFIEAFHNLLHMTSVYYRDLTNRFVRPDAFPLLNAIREVHLILAEGAHNQFGDLPWTARVEMLIQKWLLARPEMERFLSGRAMVPYQEPWMGVVDQMKTLQGWTDVTVRHFQDLAELGEQLLLSIRWGNWSASEATITSAENWATIWRDAIQGYIHAYRAVTGVDLSAASSAVQLSADSYTQPSELLRSRLVAQRRP